MNMMSELTTCIIGRTHQQCYSCYKQRTRKKQVFVANRAAEKLENSSMNQWRHVIRVENPADIRTRGMSIEGLKEFVCLNEPAWLQGSEDNWPKPWCQENELEPSKLQVLQH